MRFENITDNIYRLCVPFENIYTSVFAVCADGKWMLFDSGSNAYDVREIIVPALKQMNIVPDVLFESHNHGDHAGGLDQLKEMYPDAEVRMFCDSSAVDGETVFGCLKLLNLKGHSSDSGAVFDERSKTLLSGDSFQLWGVGRYGIAVQFTDDYFKSIEIAKGLGIRRLIASHDYYPLGFMAVGDGVGIYLDSCRKYCEEVMEFAKENPGKTPEELSELFVLTDFKRPCIPLWMWNKLKEIISL